jgi:hypothetical protein
VEGRGVIYLSQFLGFGGIRVDDAREQRGTGTEEGSGANVTHAAGTDNEDLVAFLLGLAVGGGGGGRGMTHVKEGGGTLGLEQATLVRRIGSIDGGACAAGEGREKGGEADHDEE